jgi:hypothetical protein
LVTRLLVWAATPFVLAGFWWRSMPAHDEWMTLLIAACLLLALYVGFTSWWSAVATLRRIDRVPWSGRWKRPLGWFAAAVVVAVSWLRTEADLALRLGPVGQVRTLAATDLSDGALGWPPADWRDRESALRRFREEWCGRRKLSAAACRQLRPLVPLPATAEMAAARAV